MSPNQFSVGACHEMDKMDMVTPFNTPSICGHALIGWMENVNLELALASPSVASIPDSSVYGAITLPTTVSDFVSVCTERQRRCTRIQALTK